MEDVPGSDRSHGEDLQIERAANLAYWREIYALEELASRIFERLSPSVDERVARRLANGRLTRASYRSTS